MREGQEAKKSKRHRRGNHHGDGEAGGTFLSMVNFAHRFLEKSSTLFGRQTHVLRSAELRFVDHADQHARAGVLIRLDHDGQGTIVTTRQCLLNPNRNPDWTEASAEAALTASLGARKVLWLGDGLLNDHTDGHVDNLARFVAPGVVACPVAVGRGDPNDEVYDAVARALSEMTDATGAPLKLLRLPSPGFIGDEDEKPIPASHMNFLIANGAVIVPDYGNARAVDLVCQGLKTVFPGREIIPLSSIAILSGGGSFHCISQQEPA